jgi:hypothetical protein
MRHFEVPTYADEFLFIWQCDARLPVQRLCRLRSAAERIE